ncbi:hypothetical protein LJC14_01290 [Treponema sp. OttesenSCG-928-L16]|nr:hypothetical protein [Treponema sp. OttesenSCG-928-L16]
MKRIFRRIPLWAAVCSVFSFVSCIGVQGEINLKQDGSGTIKLEYRMSLALESLGQLGGNEAWPVIPAGESDFRRSVDRIEGLRLNSFSSKTDSRDIIHTADLSFSSPEALALFLAGTGPSGLPAFRASGGENSISLTLSGGHEDLDPDLAALAGSIFAGYGFSLSLNAPGTPAFSFPGSADAGKAPVGRLDSAPGKALFQADMYDLAVYREPLVLRMEW